MKTSTIQFTIATILIGTLSLAGCSSNAKKTETAPAEKKQTAMTTEPKATETAKTEPTVTKATKITTAKKSPESKPQASSTPISAEGLLTCKAGADQRTIAINPVNSGCEVVYTKQDQANTIATAANDTTYCETVKNKVKTNLENSGYKCE